MISNRTNIHVMFLEKNYLSKNSNFKSFDNYKNQSNKYLLGYISNFNCFQIEILMLFNLKSNLFDVEDFIILAEKTCR